MGSVAAELVELVCDVAEQALSVPRLQEFLRQGLNDVLGFFGDSLICHAEILDRTTDIPDSVGERPVGAQLSREESTQNSLLSGSRRTTHVTSSPWPTSARVAPLASSASTCAV